MKQPDWNGEGKPPIGIECKFQPDGGDTWYVVKILSYFGGDVIFEAGDDYPYGKYDGCGVYSRFKHLETKDQQIKEDLLQICEEICEEYVPYEDSVDTIMSRYDIKEK